MSAQTSNNKQDLSLINRQQVIGHLVKTIGRPAQTTSPTPPQTNRRTTGSVHFRRQVVRYWFATGTYFPPRIIRRDFSLASACISTATSSSSTISTPVMVSMMSSIVTSPRRPPYSSMMTEICSRFSSIFSHI